MAAFVVRLTALQKSQLANDQPVLVAVKAGKVNDTFWLDPTHRPAFMEWMWAEQEAGREVYELAKMESNGVMQEVEIVP